MCVFAVVLKAFQQSFYENVCLGFLAEEVILSLMEKLGELKTNTHQLIEY